MPKLFIFLAVVLISLGFCFSVNAASQDLQGYIYSDAAGWISLNCSNTNSCGSISYKVSEDAKGNLSGYGYSQNNQWIDFNPTYGGVSASADNSLSGWSYSDSGNWIYISSVKIFSQNDLQNEATTTENMVNDNNTADLSSAISRLCSQFFSASECQIINGN
jgi:hypothetical protein